VIQSKNTLSFRNVPPKNPSEMTWQRFRVRLSATRKVHTSSSVAHAYLRAFKPLARL